MNVIQTVARGVKTSSCTLIDNSISKQEVIVVGFCKLDIDSAFRLLPIININNLTMGFIMTMCLPIGC